MVAKPVQGWLKKKQLVTIDTVDDTYSINIYIYLRTYTYIYIYTYPILATPPGKTKMKKDSSVLFQAWGPVSESGLEPTPGILMTSGRCSEHLDAATGGYW
jgi:hypothetical protein